jgi:hypothetical protein
MPIRRSASSSFSSVARREDSQFVGPLPSLPSWLQLAVHTATRGPQGREQLGELIQIPTQSQVLQVASRAVLASSRTVWPNTSLKLSTNGVAR